MPEVNRLFQKFLENKSTAEETEALMLLFNTESEVTLREIVLSELENFVEKDTTEDNQEVFDSVLTDIKRKIRVNRKTKRIIKMYWAAAAVLLVACLTGTAYHFFLADTPARHYAALKRHDIQPGGTNAVLTLGNGRQIILKPGQKANLPTQSGVRLQGGASGFIAYDLSAHDAGFDDVSQNTLTTPRGGQYMVILPDQTKIWLNAASELKYPVRFEGRYREVHLSGEAYFEVSKNPLHPFRVVSDKQTVEVLGTHFNVNAYPGEDHNITTLIFGSVQVNTKAGKALIKPGEHAVLDAGDEGLTVSQADLEQDLDWKDGNFVFVNERLDHIMHRLSLWYNVDIVFDSPVENKTFSGKISRQKNISEILWSLEKTKDVHFKIEGRRVTVMK